MTIKEIPRAFEYICDVCGETHRQDNAGGRYTDSRPPHWANLIMGRTAYDYQGSACADATIRRLLCGACADEVVAAINAFAETKRGAR